MCRIGLLKMRSTPESTSRKRSNLKLFTVSLLVRLFSFQSVAFAIDRYSLLLSRFALNSQGHHKAPYVVAGDILRYYMMFSKLNFIRIGESFREGLRLKFM
jgi:hypothetical protein